MIWDGIRQNLVIIIGNLTLFLLSDRQFVILSLDTVYVSAKSLEPVRDFSFDEFP